MQTEQIAKLAYEVNRAYCEAIEDPAQPKWEDAEQWRKDSVISGVIFHMTTESTPRESHENWIHEKAKDGWRFGPVIDPGKKEHPCFVPFEDLPKRQQAKDYLFKAVVDTCAGFDV